jgi:uncharacterized membrane protein
MALFSTGKLGFLIAASGVSHFVVPDVYEGITKSVFPENTSDWVMRDGACETAIGAAMMLRPTRKLGVLGLLGYVGWLGYNAAKVNS